MGCDVKEIINANATFQFQSTHPSWGATFGKPMKEKVKQISIHAPIVGCDYALIQSFYTLMIFQSTHPSWGATMQNVDLKRAIKFQSTHPSWGATLGFTTENPSSAISIHAPIVGCDIKPFYYSDDE